MLWFDMAPLESAVWRQFLATMDELKFSYQAHERFQIGTIQIVEQLDRDWDAYEAAWSGNHRRHLRKALRRAESEGGVELQLVRPHDGGEVEPLLREGFEVEHRSWKGTAGSSVLSDAVMWQFYLRQATELARCGELELAFLRYEGRADCLRIWLVIARRVLHAQSRLRQRILAIQPWPVVAVFVVEGNVCAPDRLAVDFLGPLSEATAKWTTRTYPISRLVVATSAVGKLQLKSYRRLLSSDESSAGKNRRRPI